MTIMQVLSKYSIRSTGTSQHILRYDFRELLPLLRHRWQPNHPDVKKILDRDRNLHMSIDARLQLKAANLLQHQLQRLGRSKGAVVVLSTRRTAICWRP